MFDSIKTEFEVADAEFRSCRGDQRTERILTGGALARGCRILCGRAVLLVQRHPERPEDALGRGDRDRGVFRHDAGYANGSTADGMGRPVSCEHGNRRITRTEHDGTITLLADRLADGRRFNSPNDVVVHSGGSVWFTDPSYGIDTDYEGHQAVSEIGARHAYRFGPGSGAVRSVADDFDRPNGLAFSADGRQLYLVDSGRKHLRRFDVAAGGDLSGGAVAAECDAGTFDGVRLDDSGRVWVAAHDGLHCLHPDGTLLGKLRLPEFVSNLTFGGPQRNQLFVTASTSVYTVRVNLRGVRHSAPGRRTAEAGQRPRES